MNLPSWTIINKLLGGPPAVATGHDFQELHDLCFQAIIEKGNKVAKVKLDDYSRNFNDEQYAQLYTNWIEFIKQTIPAEKLLVFNVKQGIEPLSSFCDKQKPVWKMPYVNDSEQFNSMLNFMKRVAMFLWVLVGILIYGLYENCSYCIQGPLIVVVLLRFALNMVQFPRGGKNKTE